MMIIELILNLPVIHYLTLLYFKVFPGNRNKNKNIKWKQCSTSKKIHHYTKFRWYNNRWNSPCYSCEKNNNKNIKRKIAQEQKEQFPEQSIERTCRVCKKTKNLDQFTLNGRYHKWICKDDDNARSKERYYQQKSSKISEISNIPEIIKEETIKEEIKQEVIKQKVIKKKVAPKTAKKKVPSPK